MAVSSWTLQREPCTWQHAARTRSICGMWPLGVSWTVQAPLWISGTNPQVQLNPSILCCMVHTQEPVRAISELACDLLSQHPRRILIVCTCMEGQAWPACDVRHVVNGWLRNRQHIHNWPWYRVRTLYDRQHCQLGL